MKIMKSLMILPVCGLYQEFYRPAPELLANTEKAVTSQGLLDANSLFWADILSQKAVEKTLSLAAESFAGSEHIPLPFRAAMAAPEAFIGRVLDAKIRVADQGITPRRFFSYVETLNMYCALYANVIGKCSVPFTIQSGWLLQEDSSEEVYQNCLNEEQNPYLGFINSTVLPIIKTAPPSLVFLSGRPGYFSFALARLIKSFCPSAFICVTRHSSEYYSMNKIDFLLTHNTYFFQSVDAVILEDFEKVEKEIIDILANGLPLQGVKNLIFRSDAGNIKHAGYQAPSSENRFPIVQRRPGYQETPMCVAPDEIVNAHLFPYVKCYWNQCNFCGINQKYHFENPAKAYAFIHQQLSGLKKMIGHSRYVWFIDEALPPEALGEIAAYFTQWMPGVAWQARCRIERALLDRELPETLADSGLRELRLGLESGSAAVLKKMNKFDDSFSFALVEEICKRYTSCGISIHFPIIIGFPGETDSDRHATYDLLRSLTEKYPGVTFNINLFGLDIGSRVFQHWYDFDIQSISFPCEPSRYLGNILQWSNSSADFKLLMRERDQFMRELLYPWMPARTLTPPHILYRLSETIRDTLLWKSRSLWPDALNADSPCRKMRVGDITQIYDPSKDIYYIYSWNSHHYMAGNHYLTDLIQIFYTPCTPGAALEKFYRITACPHTREDLALLIKRLVRDQYLVFDE